MRNIVTISREFGAGGGKIGRLVAEKLGYEYFDKDIIIRSAMESQGLTPEDFSRWDEKVPLNFSFAQGLFQFYDKPLNEKLFEAQRQAIRNIAEKGKCVIVGRNANVILGAFDSCLNVFVSASSYFKLNNLKSQLPGYSDEEIMNEMKKVDRARRRYCAYYTNTEFGRAEYYDLCFKSSDIGIEKCADIIVDLCK